MCHQKVYIEDDVKDDSSISNNNGFIAPNENENPQEVREDAESDRERNENDSTD